MDGIHSHIERHLKNREVFSPVNLIRTLTRMKYKGQPLVVIQMTMDKLCNFPAVSKKMNFISVPYSKVKEIVTKGLPALTRQTMVKQIQQSTSMLSTVQVQMTPWKPNAKL